MLELVQANEACQYSTNIQCSTDGTVEQLECTFCGGLEGCTYFFLLVIALSQVNVIIPGK